MIAEGCSFCGKARDEAEFLVAGPFALICAECIEGASEKLATFRAGPEAFLAGLPEPMSAAQERRLREIIREEIAAAWGAYGGKFTPADKPVPVTDRAGIRALLRGIGQRKRAASPPQSEEG